MMSRRLGRRHSLPSNGAPPQIRLRLLQKEYVVHFGDIWPITFRWTFSGLLVMHFLFFVMMMWINFSDDPGDVRNFTFMNVVETLLDTTGSLVLSAVSNTVLTAMLWLLSRYDIKMRPFHLKLLGLMQFFFLLCQYTIFKITTVGPFG